MHTAKELNIKELNFKFKQTNVYSVIRTFLFGIIAYCIQILKKK